MDPCFQAKKMAHWKRVAIRLVCQVLFAGVRYACWLILVRGMLVLVLMILELSAPRGSGSRED